MHQPADGQSNQRGDVSNHIAGHYWFHIADIIHLFDTFDGYILALI